MRPSLIVLLVVALLPALAAAAEPDATRHDFLKLLERPRVEPDVRVSDDGTRFSYLSQTDQRVPCILVRPATQPTSAPTTASTQPQRHAVVIALHGTGGTKESQLPLLRQLADRGFLAIAIDARHHGERIAGASGGTGKGSAEYQQAILRARREPGKSYPFFFDTVWDVMRLIDYLQTRDDVDPRRIGLIGTSKGGIECYLAAAADERIAAAVPCIGVQSFGWALEHDAWRPRISTIQTAFDAAAKEAGVANPDAAFVRQFYNRVAPGLADRFDGPAMLPLIAPRPLLVINGELDDRTPMDGLKLCTGAAEAAYAKGLAPDHFVIRIQAATGHKVTPESQQAALEWLVRWLQP